MNFDIYHRVSASCCRSATEAYSTSFSGAIRLLHPDLREDIYNIYGLVRFADEIVDTFHDYDRRGLLERFRADTFSAIKEGISLNPILHSFQRTVNARGIGLPLVEAFFRSMEMDLYNTRYDEQEYTEYIYGSAEVVGLMCLAVFCEGDAKRYDQLRPAARALGAAFQKVNFLRDVNADFHQLARMYFPGVDFSTFSAADKARIEADISADFAKAWPGIVQLPWKARFGVYVAYKYYLSLFRKIRRTQPSVILRKRIRIPDYQKLVILAGAGLRNRLKMI